MSKQQILFLAHRIPYPPDKGDKIRSWRLLQHLLARFDVHLICFVDDPRDFEHTPFLESLCASATFVPLNPLRSKVKSFAGILSGEPLSFRYFSDSRIKVAVEKVRSLPLCAEIVFSSSMAPFVQKPMQGRKRIVDFCDADSEKWLQYAKGAAWPLSWIYAREGRELARAESTIANWADASFAVTPDEAAIFNERKDLKSRVDWWMNGVDTQYYDPETPLGDPPLVDFVFVGAMDYRANIDGVTAFMKSAWPTIRAARANASFAIVGSNPTTEIKAFDGKDGVTVTGRVDDVRPWLMGARIVTAPLTVARGVQNKVLEAMAMGKPVLASPEAMTGINAPAGATIISTTDAMASAALSLLGDDERRTQTGRAARRFVVDTLSWEAGLSRFDAALTGLGL